MKLILLLIILGKFLEFFHCEGISGEELIRQPESDQQRLYEKLFSNYNKNIRPIISYNDITHVYIKNALYNIVSLNSQTGLLLTNSEMVFKWHDPFLIWDASLFNGTYSIRVPYHMVWIPDIVLYNMATADYDSSLLRTNVIITHSGNVTYLVHATFSSYCDIAIEWYPYDEQHCEIILSSLTGDIMQMKLHSELPDISRYEPNHEFFLENIYVTIEDEYDSCCAQPFSVLRLHIQVQRHMKFALYFFIVPGILINICALLVFALPVESGEKIGLGINSILAMIVFLMEMMSKLPPSEDIPLAGVYYGACLVVITLNILFSVVVVNISFTGLRAREIPVNMRPIILLLADWLRVSVHPCVKKKWGVNENLFEKRNEKDKMKEAGISAVNDDYFKGWTESEAINKPNIKLNSAKGMVDECTFQKRTLSALDEIEEHIHLERNQMGTDFFNYLCVLEWKFLSRVLDRILLIAFTLSAICFNSIILTMGPHETKFEYCPLGKDQCEGWTEHERLPNFNFKY